MERSERGLDANNLVEGRTPVAALGASHSLATKLPSRRTVQIDGLQCRYADSKKPRNLSDARQSDPDAYYNLEDMTFSTYKGA